jgi:hypothetical protein
MNAYRVEWVNLYTGKMKSEDVKSPSHGAADLLRAIEKKHRLTWGTVQLLGARRV